MSKQINNQAMDNLVAVELKLKGLQEVMLALAESPVSLENAPHFMYYAVSDIAEDMTEALDSIDVYKRQAGQLRPGAARVAGRGLP